MQTAQFSAIIDDIRKKKDNTLAIKLGTQEINSPEELATLFEFGNKQIWVCFAETAITKQDLNIPEVVDEVDYKSPSQRLRDRMYVYFKKAYQNRKDFDAWYVETLDKLGQTYLDKVN